MRRSVVLWRSQVKIKSLQAKRVLYLLEDEVPSDKSPKLAFLPLLTIGMDEMENIDLNLKEYIACNQRWVLLQEIEGTQLDTQPETAYTSRHLWERTERYGVGIKVLFIIIMCRWGAGNILARDKCKTKGVGMEDKYSFRSSICFLFIWGATPSFTKEISLQVDPLFFSLSIGKCTLWLGLHLGQISYLWWEELREGVRRELWRTQCSPQ